MGRINLVMDGRPVLSFWIGTSLTMGRGLDNDLRINDPRVSRHHCVVENGRLGFVIRDLDSSNGTFVNGRRITKTSLFDGDKILLGDTTLAFEQEDEAVQSDAAERGGDAEKKFYRLNGVGSFSREGVYPDSLRSTFNRLTTLFEIGNIVNTYRDPDALVQVVRRQNVSIIDADRYYLLLKNRESNTLDVAAVHPEQAGENGGMTEISRNRL